MRQRATWGWWAALLSGAIGCGQGVELSLGSERPLQREEDAGSPADAAVAETERCDSPVEAELQIDFHVDLTELVFPEGDDARVVPDEIKAAPDGSVWVLGHIQISVFVDGFGLGVTNNLWLGHFGHEGNLLGSAELAGPDSFGVPELGVNDRSEAWLAVHRHTDTALLTQIERFDAAVQSLGPPTVFDTWGEGTRLARFPNRGMVMISRIENKRGLWLLDPDGETLWSKESEYLVRGVSVPTVTGLDNIVFSSADLELDRSALWARVHGIDAEGEPLWSFISPPDLSGPLNYGRTYFMMEGDVDGNVTIAAAETNGAGPLQAWIRKVHADGALQWRRLLDINVNLGFAVEYDTGRVFVGGAEGNDGGPGTIQEILPDGELCRKHPYSGIPPLQRLSASPAGELFFLTFDSVGRFHYIEPLR